MERPRPGGITWTIAGERLALLAWPRAILLQLAHPLVAAGVAAHSGFRGSPLAPLSRLHATVSALRRLTFGSDDEAADTVRGILRVHDRVNGSLREGAGPYPPGARYSAHDPALLLWVHATLLDSHVRVLEHVIGPFTPGDRDGYCHEAAPFAVVLGATPADVPRTWQRLQDYVAGEIASGRVAVRSEARALAPAVLRPAVGRLVWPLQYACEIVTIGTLPSVIRSGYGFVWDDTRERRMHRVLATLRRVRAHTPDRLARWPEARRLPSSDQEPSAR
jgi:uncharacterized protein (DUF2236 family)